MNMFEEYKVEDGGIWIPKDELEKLRAHYHEKAIKQAQYQMYNDFNKSIGKESLINNLIGLIEENE